jgi:synaptosomal-associated protein 25
MDKAEKHLTNLQKFAGLFVLPWQRVGGKHRTVTNSSTTHSSEKSSPTIAEPKVHKTYEKETPTSEYITRITNDSREDEMNNNLDSISSFLGNLKENGMRMGDALEKQNEKLDRIAKKNEAGVERVADATKQTQNILKN